MIALRGGQCWSTWCHGERWRLAAAHRTAILITRVLYVWTDSNWTETSRSTWS